MFNRSLLFLTLMALLAINSRAEVFQGNAQNTVGGKKISVPFFIRITGRKAAGTIGLANGSFANLRGPATSGGKFRLIVSAPATVTGLISGTISNGRLRGSGRINGPGAGSSSLVLKSNPKLLLGASEDLFEGKYDLKMRSNYGNPDIQNWVRSINIELKKTAEAGSHYKYIMTVDTIYGRKVLTDKVSDEASSHVLNVILFEYFSMFGDFGSASFDFNIFLNLSNDSGNVSGTHGTGDGELVYTTKRGRTEDIRFRIDTDRR